MTSTHALAPGTQAITRATAPGTHLATTRALRDALTSDAARLERVGVTREDTDRLAATGLYGVYGPTELGGAEAAEQREVAELLAGASPDLWFVWFQHGPVVKMLAGSDNSALQDRHLAGLVTGALHAGVSYSHLRTPRPSILAERVTDGFVLSGSQPWCTGWGLTDLVLVGALVPDTDEVVFGLIPGGDQPGVRSSGALDLAAMGGTATHGLVYDGLLLPSSDVVNVLPLQDFLAFDASRNTNVQPSTFGIALAALDLLEARVPEVAAVLRDRVSDARRRAYALLDDVAFGERDEERLAVRAEALLLGVECTTALLTARGGQGMDLADPAQRLLRAAAFQIIHSQAAGIRAATLAALVA